MAELFERHDRSRFEVTAISFGPARRRRHARAHRSGVSTASSTCGAVATSRWRSCCASWRSTSRSILMGSHAGCAPGHPRVPAGAGAGELSRLSGDDGGASSSTTSSPTGRLMPEGSERFYAEKVVRLPDCYQAERHASGGSPSARRRARSWGCRRRGFVFCSFNNSFKITPPVFDVWMRLLRAVDGSVLWLLETSATVEARTCGGRRRRAGWCGERLVFAPRMAAGGASGAASAGRPVSRHAAVQRAHDGERCVVGGVAGADVRWARSFAARVAGEPAARGGAAGAGDDEPGGVRGAGAGAGARCGDGWRRCARGWRRNRPTAPLFDIERYRRHLEAAYETMWERHLRGEPPQAFDVGTTH